MLASKHHKETERLAALYRYHILDTDYEQAFDDITWLASHLCGTPVAVVNLIDAQRQWFKSEIGLGVRETPLDISICAHAILQPGLYIVPDTQADPLFADNPLVTGDPHLRFYAGALLESPDGYPLGTLCVLDYQPRELTDAQQTALAALGRQVMALIEARLHAAEIALLNERLHSLITESHHRIKNSLQVLAALIELQQPDAGGNVAHTEFVRVGQHIRGLSTIHDLLTLSSKTDTDISSLQADELVYKLLQAMEGLFGTRQIHHQVAELSLSAKKATSLVLLLNELISNGVKHGRGDMTVTLAVTEQEARLEVCDDGPGFPSDFNPDTAANTGLDLIKTLSEWDLRGRVAYENRTEGGARVVVLFPV